MHRKKNPKTNFIFLKFGMQVYKPTFVAASSDDAGLRVSFDFQGS